MIWLFCNDRLGRPFLEKARAKPRDPDLAVVFSSRQPIAAIRRKIRETKARSAWRQRVILVDDINSASFTARIGRDDHGIVAGFNQIFSETTIARFATLVNFHPSILPLYRGPVPSHWCLENGETKTGFTLHRVTPDVDAGEILFQQEVGIEPGVTEEQLDQQIAAHAAEVFVRYRMHLDTGDPWEGQHVDAEMTYREKVDYRTFPT